MRAQVAAMREGVDDVFPCRALAAFSPDEINALVCPSEMEWTAENLRRCFVPDSSHSSGSAAANRAATDAVIRVVLMCPKAWVRRLLWIPTHVPRLVATLAQAPIAVASVPASADPVLQLRSSTCERKLMVAENLAHDDHAATLLLYQLFVEMYTDEMRDQGMTEINLADLQQRQRL